MPTDREVFACVHCAHPYWWNDEENSSPAKALRKAEELYQMIASALGRPLEKPRPTPTTATRAETEAIAKRDDISLLNDLRDTAAKQAATAAEDTEAIAAELTAMSLSATEDAVEAVEMPEEFRLASQLMRQRSVDALPALVSVFHPNTADGRTPTEAEPAATNWAGEFIGYVHDMTPPGRFPSLCELICHGAAQDLGLHLRHRRRLGRALGPCATPRIAQRDTQPEQSAVGPSPSNCRRRSDRLR